MTPTEQYIENQVGILSGDLADFLSKTHKISKNAAKKRVERLKEPIHRLTGLFADNQSFIYHATYYQSPEYFEKLSEAIQTAAKRYYAVISSINYHHGLIRKNELPNFCFSPVANLKGHINVMSLIKKMNDINILHEYDEDHFRLNPVIAEKSEPNFRHFKAIQLSKELVLHQFETWSKNIGLVSFNQTARNQQVAGFQFSFAAPSYVNGLVQTNKTKPKPGFVVADILLGNTTNSSSVDFFIRKIEIIRASNPTTKLFPAIIVDGIHIDALNKLKSLGVIIASVSDLFGKQYSELLKNLINTVTNAGAILKTNPESFIQLMEQIEKLATGKTNNLRGDLFELAVGYYYAKECQSLDVGKKFRATSSQKFRDIDVLAVYENEVRMVECKGYNYPIDEEYVKTYLTEIVPDMREWALDVYPNKKMIFEIWSTGGFTEESEQLLTQAAYKTKRYQIKHIDKQSILERAQSLQTGKFTEILRQYYFKEIS